MMMDGPKIQIHGIYDSRTLKSIQNENIRDFSFDFSPRSFNFIQEHVFLDLLKNTLNENDNIYLTFDHESDYMISKLLKDIKNFRPLLKNVFLIFKNINALEKVTSEVPFFIHYDHQLKSSIVNSPNCRGVLIDFFIIEEAFLNNSVNKFYSNFLIRFNTFINENKSLILKVSWSDHLISSVLDIIDINFIYIELNNEVEICYRNIDLKKVQRELSLKKKYLNI
jgi:hypothetical protein